jgi:hypothetical protein
MIREHFETEVLVRAIARVAVVVAVVGAGAYFMWTSLADAPITTVVPKKDARSTGAAPDASRAPARPRASSSPTVYRCRVNGSVIYSEEPCPGGEVIELVVPKGFEPTPVPGAPAADRSGGRR